MCIDHVLQSDAIDALQSYDDSEALKVVQKHVLADYQAHKVRRPLLRKIYSYYSIVTKKASYVEIE